MGVRKRKKVKWKDKAYVFIIQKTVDAEVWSSMDGCLLFLGSEYSQEFMEGNTYTILGNLGMQKRLYRNSWHSTNTWQSRRKIKIKQETVKDNGDRRLLKINCDFSKRENGNQVGYQNEN